MVPLGIVLSVTLVFLAVTCVEVALVGPIARRLTLPPSLDFITAVAALALFGFALFWVYLLDPRAGTVALAALWTVILTLTAQRVRASAHLPLSADFVQPLVLTLSSACLGLGMLLLFRTPEAAAQIAAHRFTMQPLPADNVIPQIFAERLLDGQSPKALIGDWLSSDRPPLATGWMLLFQQPLQLAGVSRANAFFIGAFTFQMTWVAGVWAVLRACRCGRSASTIAIVFTAFTSVTLINSVFTWPKLSAGAFTLAAWAMLLGSRRIGRAGAVLCAVFLTLAMLSHGAAALAVVATLFVLAVEWLRQRDRCQMRIAACGVAAGTALYAPWFAYQRWYEPPGDRLVKWHLAGVIPIDGRSSTRTLVDAYRQLSVREWLDLRWSNTNVLCNCSGGLGWRFARSARYPPLTARVVVNRFCDGTGRGQRVGGRDCRVAGHRDRPGRHDRTVGRRERRVACPAGVELEELIQAALVGRLHETGTEITADPFRETTG